MKKIIQYAVFLPLIAVLALALAIAAPTAPAANASFYTPKVGAKDAYKAIVKIKTFARDENFRLKQYSEGSGVFITEYGAILTNHHVATLTNTFDNSEAEVAYQVCITEAQEKEPNCTYTAKLVDKDKGLDIALLEIEPIEGLSAKHPYPFLARAQLDAAAIGDPVQVLGYPSIGGDTVTITKGAISGRQDKYNKKWFKTDAVVSFGNSGGATIDATGNLIGITTASYVDLLGSLGYIINIVSLNDWLSPTLLKTARAGELFEPIKEFTRTQNALQTTNTFSAKTAPFTITKPNSWKFSYTSERIVALYDETDEDGGGVTVSSLKLPYNIDNAGIVPILKKGYNTLGTLSLVTFTKDKDVVVNGTSGRLVTVSSLTNTRSSYVFPSEGNLIVVDYDYGRDEKDRALVDGIINSLVLSKGDESFFELGAYSHSNPEFHISTPSVWAIQKTNTKSTPIEIWHKTISEAFVVFNIEKANEHTRDLDNDGYLAYTKQKIQEMNQRGNTIDLKIEIAQSNAHFALNSELSDVVFIEYLEKKAGDGEALARMREYYIKTGDAYLTVGLQVYHKDQSVFDKASADFKRLAQSLSLVDFIPQSAVQLVDEKQNEGAAAQKEDAPPLPLKRVVQPPKHEPEREQFISVADKMLYARLKGQIVLKVEDSGKAYYVHPKSETIHYLGRPEDAFAVMREQGSGITDANLAKVPIGVRRISGKDTDGDGLSDAFEGAIGTDAGKADSDSDGLSDKTEIELGANPKGAGAAAVNKDFANQQKGKILLQVEGKGEAWYVNPKDGKRYFLGRPEDAFAVMQDLGLGMSNSNFDKLKGGA